MTSMRMDTAALKQNISQEKRGCKQDEISEIAKTSQDELLGHNVEADKSITNVKCQFMIFTLSILCSVSSYSGLMDLQSSINITDGLGNKSLALMSVSTIVCCMFFTPVIISAFGAKVTIHICQTCYVVYVLANFYPSTYTLFPGSVVFGIAEALLYTPALMYCTHYGRLVTNARSKNTKNKINLFVGYFWGVYQMNEVFSNLISTIVLSIGKRTAEELQVPQYNRMAEMKYADGLFDMNQSTTSLLKTEASILNESEQNTSDNARFNTTVNLGNVTQVAKIFFMCGANDCYDEKQFSTVIEQYVPISTTAYFIMTGVYTFLAVIAIPMMMYIPALPSTGNGEDPEDEKVQVRKISAARYCRMIKNNFIEMIAHFVDVQQLLLTPLTLYHGLYVAFISSEINRAYVSCTVGVEKVGIGMMLGGIMNVTVSFIYGSLAGNSLLRNVMLITVVLLDLLLYFFCLFWIPTEDTAWMSYLICLLFGATDGVWSPFLDGKYAKYFHDKEKIAYTVQTIWSCVGFTLMYGWTSLLCVRQKIYVVISFLLSGIVFSAGAECLQKRKNKV